MADGELKTPRLSAAQANALMRPMEMDLMAIYAAMQEDAFELLDGALDEGLTPERFMAEVERMFDVEEQGEDLVAKALPRVEFQGLPITIENRPGSVREGEDRDGHPWRTKMRAPYGFIRGTEGTDGDEVDVFIGQDIMSPWVYVFHIAGPDDDAYDEDKVILGCADLDDAAMLLKSHYDRPMEYEPELFHIEDFKAMMDDLQGEPIAGETTRAILEAQKAGADRGLVWKAMRVADLYHVAKASAAQPGTVHTRADGSSWQKQADGSWQRVKAPRQPGRADETREKESRGGSPSPEGTKADWTPEEGGTLFHGTAMPDDERYTKGDEDGVVYFTDDYREAEAYAGGVHLGGSEGGSPRVLYVDANPGETVDINREIEAAVEEGDEFGPIFEKARGTGAKYVTYDHPSNVGEGTQRVIVALDPGDQLGPARRGWDIAGKRAWSQKAGGPKQ